MKIAFIFGGVLFGGRPLDFNTLWTSPRGLTGSDLGVVVSAKEMAKLGHDVSLFTICTPNQPAIWEGIKLYDLNKESIANHPDFDAVISWNDPDVLRPVVGKPVRVVCQMLNDFSYCQPGFDNFVDAWTAPCQMLIDHLTEIPNAPPKDKFVALPLGCDPSWYSDGSRVPGRVVWTSSADRGLHLLLQEWPKIKAAVPNANLRVFYNFNYNHVIGLQPNDTTQHKHSVEMAHRARYMLEAMKRLKPFGVEAIGSISRERMASELSEAMVLGYPCSTIAFTEGFSVSILESCAAGVFPVISSVDCLGSIYGGVVPMVESPVEKHMDEFTNLVIRGLTDEPFRKETIAKCKEFANKHTWAEATKKLEKIVLDHRKTNAK